MRSLRHLPAALSALIAAAVGSACGNSAVSTCEAQVRASCELQYRCCDAEERVENAFAFGLVFIFNTYSTSEGECIDRALPFCKATSASLDDAAAVGRIDVDDTKAQECLDALNAARDDCDINAFIAAQSAAEEGPCSEIVKGLVKDGDECAASNECEDDGAFCDFGDEPEANEELGTVVGECVGPAGEGESCEDNVCDDGLFCDFGDQTCKDLPGDGEECPDFVCDENLQCGALGVCEPLPGEGEACISDCADGLFCDLGLCADQVAPGEPCDGFQFDECAQDGECVDGVCEVDEPEELDICKGN